MGDSGEGVELDVLQAPERNRRRALWGALAALVVAGGALAVTAGSDDGAGELQALPVGLGAPAAGAEAAMSADMSMAAWVTYVAGERLPELGGEGPAHRLVDDVDDRDVAALAEALGLAGEPQRTPEGSWRLESAAGMLEVFEGGGGGWWFAADTGSHEGSSDTGSGSSSAEPSPDTPTGSGEDSCAPTASCGSAESPVTTVIGPSAGIECITYEDAGGTVEECTSESQPPAEDLPSKEDAEQIALDLLAATGLEVDGAKVSIEGPYDAWYVIVEPMLEGLPVAGWTSSVGVGPEGKVLNASGTLASAERLGDYPLITTTAAIERLNSQSAGFGGAEPVPMPLPAPETTIYDDVATATTGAAGTCVTQADGREICETEIIEPVPPAGSGMLCPQHEAAPGATTTVVDGATTDAAAPSCAPPLCPDVVAPADQPVTTVPDPRCGTVEPVPLPEPEPLEVVITGAERVLVLMSASDGSSDTYLVPGYRLTSDDGHLVDIPAVPDDLLADGSADDTAPTVTQPATTGTGMESPPCVLTEEVSSGSTHTVVSDCSDMTTTTLLPDPVPLADGEKAQIGVPYYVDVQIMSGHCSWIYLQFDGRWWWAEMSNDELARWATPTEGGSLTLIDEMTAAFQGDHARTKIATLTQYDDGTHAPMCA